MSSWMMVDVCIASPPGLLSGGSLGPPGAWALHAAYTVAPRAEPGVGIGTFLPDRSGTGRASYRSGVDDLDPHRLRVGDRPVEHCWSRIRYGQPRADHRQPPEARVGEHLVDGGAVTPGDQRDGRSPLPGVDSQDPSRVLGGRLVGLSRLVVAAPGEALLALPTGLGPALD